MRVPIVGWGMVALLHAELAWAYPGFDPVYLLTPSPLPANGVFAVGSVRSPITDTGEIALAVVGPDGPVSGTLEVVNATLVFRPDHALAVGEYSVSVTPAPGTVFGGDATYIVEVTESVTIDPPEVTCSLTLAATIGAGSSEQCCGLLPDSYVPEPHCFATTANSNHVGLSAVSCAFDLHGAPLGYQLCRLVDAPTCELALTAGSVVPPCPQATDAAPTNASDLALPWSAPSGSVPALVEADEYCVELACLDVRTGLPFGARQCEQHPELEPVEGALLEPDVVDLGIAFGCEVPPAGLESSWCALNRSYFEEDCADDAPVDRLVTLRCAEYEARCRAGEDRVEAGCGCRTPPARGAAGGIWLGLCVLACSRRRRPAARRPRRPA